MYKYFIFKGSPIGDDLDKRVDIHEKLAQSENLMKEMSQTWEEKLVKSGYYTILIYSLYKK